MLDPRDDEQAGAASAPDGAPEAPGGPERGVGVPAAVALDERTMRPVSADSSGTSAVVGPVTRHPCSAIARSGRACGRTVATVATSDGWRCPSHRQRAEAPAASRPPVRSIRSPADALRLASWAALEVAAGRMRNVDGNSIANLCREARRGYDAGKHGAAYDAAVDVVDALLAVLADPGLDSRVVQKIVPPGGPLDRAVKAYLAAARRAVTPG